MKLDDIALNNVLKAYGRELRTSRPDKKGYKPDISANPTATPAKNPEDLKVLHYNQNGLVQESFDKKKQLIDFFE